MDIIGAYEAKTHLPDLLRRAEQGERILISRHGMPIAMLSPVPFLPSQNIAQTIQDLMAFRARHQCGELTIEDMKNTGRR